MIFMNEPFQSKPDGFAGCPPSAADVESLSGRREMSRKRQREDKAALQSNDGKGFCWFSYDFTENSFKKARKSGLWV